MTTQRMQRHIFISAVEESGAEIMQKIISEFQSQGLHFEYRGLMNSSENFKSMFPIHLLSRNGLWDVLFIFPTYIKVLLRCFWSLWRNSPQLAIFVDFPVFNKILAKFCLKIKVPVYYISPPQVWAYQKEKVNPLFERIPVQVLFPFEVIYYQSRGIKVSQAHFFEVEKKENLKTGIGLFPGSRYPVIRRNLPDMLKIIRNKNKLQQINIVLPIEFHDKIKKRIDCSQISFFSSLDAISGNINRAISFPGTMTLYLALKGIPTFVMGRIDFLTFYLMKSRIKTKWLSLPNILWKKQVFPEIIYCFFLKSKQTKIKMQWNRFLKEQQNVPGIKNFLGNGSGEQIVVQNCLLLMRKNDKN